MQPTQIIIKPLITEKSTWESQARNRVSFEVHPDANKQQIRDAVQKLYKVRVLSVATQNRDGKTKRTRYGVGVSPSWKRATVQLHEEDRIDLF
ncbi:MAG: 50S ribosomal protein L23 [Planctomycetes bacterium]|nr:50S ribosomal protein L23 [Planctomycetota bacterium]